MEFLRSVVRSHMQRDTLFTLWHRVVFAGLLALNFSTLLYVQVMPHLLNLLTYIDQQGKEEGYYSTFVAKLSSTLSRFFDYEIFTKFMAYYGPTLSHIFRFKLSTSGEAETPTPHIADTPSAIATYFYTFLNWTHLFANFYLFKAIINPEKCSLELGIKVYVIVNNLAIQSLVIKFLSLADDIRDLHYAYVPMCMRVFWFILNWALIIVHMVILLGMDIWLVHWVRTTPIPAPREAESNTGPGHGAANEDGGDPQVPRD